MLAYVLSYATESDDDEPALIKSPSTQRLRPQGMRLILFHMNNIFSAFRFSIHY